jgi:histidinol-phosphatase (PHP family)
MTPIYFDSHMHTPLCKHAYGEPEEYAEQAIKMGLRGIIFTCHSPMPRGFWPQVRMGMEEFADYCALVQRAADAFRGKLEIRLGMESDYFPGFEEWIAELHGKAPFHYCLGSVHFQGKDYMERFETGNPQEFRRTYFKLLADSAETGLFDCLAHPDLVKNYKPYDWRFEEVKEDIAAALDRIAKTGVAMEFNTSGIHKRSLEFNPGIEMLEMMYARGIPVVIGSDSHAARRVGESFTTALEILQNVGYQHVSVFENRERSELPIAEVLASLPPSQQVLVAEES